MQLGRNIIFQLLQRCELIFAYILKSMPQLKSLTHYPHKPAPPPPVPPRSSTIDHTSYSSQFLPARP